MKVTCVTTSLKTNGGLGRVSLEIISRLKQRGIQCSVIVQRADGDAPVDAELLPSRSMLNLVRNSLLVRKLSRGSDVVHAFDAWPFGMYAWFAVLGTKKKLMINGIGTYSLVPKKFGLKRLLMKIAYRRADAVLCVSEYLRVLIAGEVPSAQTAVVHLGNAPLPAVSSEFIADVVEKYSLRDRTPMVLTVGDIKTRKGQFDTLRAVVRLRTKFPYIIYVAIGSEFEPGYIKEMKAYTEEEHAADVLRLLFSVDSREEVAAFFNLCNAYALNSNCTSEFVEGFGLSIIEANSVGKLAVGSSESGIEDSIQNGYSGYLVPQGDDQRIAGAIEKILAEDAQKAALRAKEWATHFTWDKTVDGYIAHYGAN